VILCGESQDGDNARGREQRRRDLSRAIHCGG